MVPAPLGLPCRKRPPAFRSPPSGRDAVATLVPAASPAGRTGKHGFRSRTDCLTLRPNYLIDSMSVTTPAATVSARSEEHTSELQSLMRISYAVFCLKKKTTYTHHQ